MTVDLPDAAIDSQLPEFLLQAGNSESPQPSDPVAENYHRRETERRDELAALDRVTNRLSNLRLLTGVALLAAIVWGIADRGFLPGGIAIVAAVLFGAFVVRYKSAAARSRRAAEMATINAEAAVRVLRNWELLALWHAPRDDPSHPYARDLDIFGHGSLFHLLDTTATQMGEQCLSGWLLQPAPLPAIAGRQRAVNELAPLLDWRQELQLLGRLGSAERQNPDAFLAWAEGDRALERRPWLIWLARAGLALTVAVLLLAALRLIDPAFIAIPLLVNLAITFGPGSIIESRNEVARTHHAAMTSYGRLLEHLDTRQFQSPLLSTMIAALGGQEHPAHEQVRRLGRITSWAIPRSSLAHLLLQAVASWDVHVLHALEGWHRDNGRHVRDWLQVIGEFEALAALANVAHDNPDWCFPGVDARIAPITALQLGHPLIPAATRVCNDVTVGPPGTFLLVTGSNMSGKSTLLRAIGVNIVLAQAGGPVCATSLTLPPVSLWTSARVVDSLEQGISYYMAELLRLKAIDSAARAARQSGRPFCYLLDEILQGTNSAERQIAARHIIASLVEMGAIGAVSTHDLNLAATPDMQSKAISVHFSDTVSSDGDEPAMSFDYQLRTGPATSTNALKLMKLVGFDMSSELERSPLEPIA